MKRLAGVLAAGGAVAAIAAPTHVTSTSGQGSLALAGMLFAVVALARR